MNISMGGGGGCSCSILYSIILYNYISYITTYYTWHILALLCFCKTRCESGTWELLGDAWGLCHLAWLYETSGIVSLHRQAWPSSHITRWWWVNGQKPRCAKTYKRVHLLCSHSNSSLHRKRLTWFPPLPPDHLPTLSPHSLTVLAPWKVQSCHSECQTTA